MPLANFRDPSARASRAEHAGDGTQSRFPALAGLHQPAPLRSCHLTPVIPISASGPLAPPIRVFQRSSISEHCQRGTTHSECSKLRNAGYNPAPMRHVATRLVLLLGLAVLSGLPGYAQNMKLQQFDRMAGQDQIDYISQLQARVRASVKGISSPRSTNSSSRVIPAKASQAWRASSWIWRSYALPK